jgi:hypothetical protein
MNTRTVTQPAAWRGIFFEGPEPERGHDGDEFPVWFVYIGDEDRQPISTAYKCFDFAGAEMLARRTKPCPTERHPHHEHLSFTSR